MSKMKVVKKDDGWWVTNIPDTVTENGPYDSRPEAVETRDGLARLFKALDDGTFGSEKW